MSETHDGEHELWLAGLLAGEFDRNAPEVARRLAACGPCRERLDELASVAAELAGAGADQRADLDQAARAGPAPGEERVSARLAELAEREPHAARSRRAWPWLAAAALLIAAGLLWRALAIEPAKKGPVSLGDEDSSAWEILAPIGEGSSFAHFEWRYHGEASGFLLRIYDADSPATPPEEFRCKESSWTPDAAILQALPARILWEVDALGPRGTIDDKVSGSRSFSASRS